MSATKISINSIPQGWIETRLKDVATCNDEALSDSVSPEKEIRYVEISDVSEEEGITNVSSMVFGEAPSRARRITRKGDVVISTVRTYLRAVALVEEDDLIVSTGFAVLRPKSNVLSRYLHYLLLEDSLLSEVIKGSTGVSYPAIQTGSLVSLPIILPPLDEQMRIANYLDKKIAAINATIAARDEELKLLKKFKQSKIAEVVTHGLTPNVPTKSSPLGQIPAHWEVKRVKDVVSEMFMGTSPDYEYEEENTNYVFGQRNNQLGYIDFSGIKYAKQSFFDERPDFEFLRYGDVLLNTLGGGSVGRAGYYNLDDGKKVITDGHIMVIRSNTYNTKYMYYYLLSQKAFLENLAIGSTNQAFFNISDIRVISLPCPPIEEQSEIAHYLGNECEKIDRKCKLIDEQIKKMQLLKRALINEVVTGKRQLA